MTILTEQFWHLFDQKEYTGGHRLKFFIPQVRFANPSKTEYDTTSAAVNCSQQQQKRLIACTTKLAVDGLLLNISCSPHLFIPPLQLPRAS